MDEIQNLERSLTNIMFWPFFELLLNLRKKLRVSIWLNINLVTHKKILAVVQSDLRLSHKLTFYTNTDDLKFAAIL